MTTRFRVKGMISIVPKGLVGVFDRPIDEVVEAEDHKAAGKAILDKSPGWFWWQGPYTELEAA